MWFLFTLITILLWGGADVFYKIGSDPADKYSHWKIVAVVGIIMGFHALGYIAVSGIRFEPINIVRYLPVSLLYIASMTLGYAGLRHIELSVCSPVCNSSGAVAFVLCFLFLRSELSALQIIAVVVSSGIFWLALIERGKQQRVKIKVEGKKKLRFGFLAILFPILYCIIDGVGTFADAVVLDRVMDEDQALMSYEITFFIIAVFAVWYIVVIRKQKFTFAEQKARITAGVFETAGQFFYIRAMAENAVIAAPLVACFSVVSVLLSRLFLKEKLTKLQYSVIAVIMAAVGIIGVE